MTPARQPDILVLCPMEIERKAVAAEVLAAGLEHVAIVRTGIGKIAIVEHVQRAAAMAARPRLVILAGACGALRPVEDVPPVGRVIDEHGGEWVGLGMAPAGRTVVGVDRIVATPLEKRELADRTGAVIVDMESHAFSAACEGLGLSWTIVRGVSDSPEE
jgi:nucleoside phosphorylase